MFCYFLTETQNKLTFVFCQKCLRKLSSKFIEFIPVCRKLAKNSLFKVEKELDGIK